MTDTITPAADAPEEEPRDVDGLTENVEESTDDSFEKHWIQKFYDNPWILLVLGLLIPFVSYTAWGWIDLLAVPPAELP